MSAGNLHDSFSSRIWSFYDCTTSSLAAWDENIFFMKPWNTCSGWMHLNLLYMDAFLSSVIQQNAGYGVYMSNQGNGHKCHCVDWFVFKLFTWQKTQRWFQWQRYHDSQQHAAFDSTPAASCWTQTQFWLFVCLQVSTLPVERRTLKSTVPEGADTHAECLLVRRVSSDLEVMGDVHLHFQSTDSTFTLCSYWNQWRLTLLYII